MLVEDRDLTLDRSVQSGKARLIHCAAHAIPQLKTFTEPPPQGVFGANFIGKPIMRMEPQGVRYQLEQSPKGVFATIPSRKNWFVILFLGVWTCAWAGAEVSVLKEMINPHVHPPVLFVSTWLSAWTLGGVFAIGTLLWQLAGREVIGVESDDLVHKIGMFGFVKTRTYSAGLITHLRVVDYSPNMFTQQKAWMPPLFGSGVGPITFDFGASTFRLGQYLTESEARMLVEELSRRLPNSVRQQS